MSQNHFSPKHLLILAVLIVPIVFVSHWVSKETDKINPAITESPKNPVTSAVSELPKPPAVEIPTGELPESTDSTAVVPPPPSQEKEIIYEKPLDDVLLVQ